MKRVYVAGPYTKGDVAVNVRNAVQAAHVLMEHGFAPYVPHLSHYWHTIFPRPYEDWMALDLVWLAQCDVMVRLSGESSGADREVMRAHELGMPVYFDVQDLIAEYVR